MQKATNEDIEGVRMETEAEKSKMRNCYSQQLVRRGQKLIEHARSPKQRQFVACALSYSKVICVNVFTHDAHKNDAENNFLELTSVYFTIPVPNRISVNQALPASIWNFPKLLVATKLILIIKIILHLNLRSRRGTLAPALLAGALFLAVDSAAFSSASSSS